MSIALNKKVKGKQINVMRFSFPLPRSVFAALAVPEAITKAYSSHVLTLNDSMALAAMTI